jgi:hypothetical protein
MRVLVDECFPSTAVRLLTGHEFVRARRAGLAGVKNGRLLRAASGRFHVLLTTDRHIELQQKVPSDLAVVCAAARTNDVGDLLPLLPRVQSALSWAPRGRVTTIRP